MSALEKAQRADLAVVEAQAPVTLFRTEKPAEVVARASEMAHELAKVVKKQKLTTRISGRDHVRVEGWTLLGTMLGVFPICQWTRKMENGWEARVEARTLAGQLIGAAEAQCLRSENLWKSRDDYALRSMAQTRATSKALRQPLGFVMTLAGFDATPAEEMPHDDIIDAPAARTPQFNVPDALAPGDDDDPERARLAGELLRLANQLGKFDATVAAIGKNRRSHTIEEQKVWLLDQIAKANKKLGDQQGTLA
jgi:hypothetical protein